LASAKSANKNPDSTSFRSRQDRLRIRFSGLNTQAILVTSLPDIRYLCGFSGSSGILLITENSSELFTDSRYTLQTRDEVHASAVNIIKKSLLNEVGARIAHYRAIQRLAFAPDQITFARFRQIQRVPKRSIKWVPASLLVADLRAIKDPEELAAMRAAAILSSQVFEKLLPKIRPGVSELDLAAELDYLSRTAGASGPAFDTIIASGPRAALPHAHPTSKLISKNELVVIDQGAILRGYCSDITRTVFVGKAPPRIRRWYNAVLESQLAAIEALGAGVEANTVDAAARGTLKRMGLAGAFTHSTGHGLGLEVHEAPRLGRGDKSRLALGNVVTIEPGIYKQGIGGIRIEDDVFIGASGSEILSNAPKEFLEL
jgi:Xaa-Pro aminopeptidase